MDTYYLYSLREKEIGYVFYLYPFGGENREKEKYEKKKIRTESDNVWNAYSCV